MSHGFGSTKQPDSCSSRNLAARAFCVDFMAQHYTCSGDGTILREEKAAPQRKHFKRKREMENYRNGQVFGVRRCSAASYTGWRQVTRNVYAETLNWRQRRGCYFSRFAFQICRSGPSAP